MQPRRRLDTEVRRQAILDAAKRAYAQDTYADVPIGRIAEAAGSSPALVFHYFGSKAGLYCAVVEDAVAALQDAQADALARLPPGTSARDQVQTSLLVYLNHIATHPNSWATPLAGGEEPRAAVELRRRARQDAVTWLRQLLQVGSWRRHSYAIWGYLGFVDQACLAWVNSGCPPEDRPALIEAALGALEGALGDWGH